MYLIDINRMKKGENVVFSTWGAKYTAVEKNKIKENEPENYQKYSKTIENTKIELEIPNEWKYTEIPQNEENNYKYALRLYKTNEEQCAILYFRSDMFAVCGTGRTTEEITLKNGKEATIGYYDGNKNWSDISFYNTNKYISILNNGLTDDEAKEAIEIIKTINISNEQGESSFYGTITQVENNLFFVEPDEGEEIRKSADKIMVKILQLDTDIQIKVGERVKITYDGVVMTTYPAQINVIKYEAIN